MNRRIQALQEAANKKAKEAYERVEKTLMRMIQENQKINFQTVANSAKVSPAYLYKHPEIKSRIQTLREQQKKQAKNNKCIPASANSQAVIIFNLREEIKRVRNENLELRRANEALTGNLYQLQNYHQLFERLKIENDFLKNRIKELIEQLENSQSQVPKQVVYINQFKVNKISDSIKKELQIVGIKLNSTLTKVIELASEETVLNAIKAYKEALIVGTIKRPGGWLKKAIEEQWQPNN